MVYGETMALVLPAQEASDAQRNEYFLATITTKLSTPQHSCEDDL